MFRCLITNPDSELVHTPCSLQSEGMEKDTISVQIHKATSNDDYSSIQTSHTGNE